jgi:hypothetical protein
LGGLHIGFTSALVGNAVDAAMRRPFRVVAGPVSLNPFVSKGDEALEMAKTYISVAMHGFQSSESSRIHCIAHLGYGWPEVAKLHA